jgi:hypothetical protein
VQNVQAVKTFKSFAKQTGTANRDE